MKLIDRVKEAMAPAEFGSFMLSHADKHDQMIAFTSQMAHVVSNAYVKSPTANEHHGFSAGSYKDLTRVAWLNAPMWVELFMENKDNLVNEIAKLIADVVMLLKNLAKLCFDCSSVLCLECDKVCVCRVNHTVTVHRIMFLDSGYNRVRFNAILPYGIVSLDGNYKSDSYHCCKYSYKNITQRFHFLRLASN